MKVVIINQARMTSTRLPGKVLLPVLGKPLLAYQTERLRRCARANEIVLATTTNSTDEPLVDFCRTEKLRCVRGSETNVLSRYRLAAEQSSADIIVRVTSDCPLIDPAVVDRAITLYLEARGKLEYVTNVLNRTFPTGMDVEVFSRRALEEANTEAPAGPDQEHVTPFIRGHADRYPSLNFAFSVDQSRHRWTVDTPDDFKLVSLLLSTLYPKNPYFTLEDGLALIAQHPEWETINQHVKAKKPGE